MTVSSTARHVPPALHRTALRAAALLGDAGSWVAAAQAQQVIEAINAIRGDQGH